MSAVNETLVALRTLNWHVIHPPGPGCGRDGWPGCCGRHKSNTSSGPGGGQLTAAGARPDQVVKLTIYVAGYTSEYLPVIEQARCSYSGTTSPPTRSSAWRG
jgi:hypothetical protein